MFARPTNEQRAGIPETVLGQPGHREGRPLLPRGRGSGGCRWASSLASQQRPSGPGPPSFGLLKPQLCPSRKSKGRELCSSRKKWRRLPPLPEPGPSPAPTFLTWAEHRPGNWVTLPTGSERKGRWPGGKYQPHLPEPIFSGGGGRTRGSGQPEQGAQESPPRCTRQLCQSETPERPIHPPPPTVEAANYREPRPPRLSRPGRPRTGLSAGDARCSKQS